MSTSGSLAQTFDVAAIRADFPALQQEVNGRPLVYLDNAATSQKPRQVIDRLVRYYERENSNVHRGVHYLSRQATDSYEAARVTIGSFIGVNDPGEIIYTRGTTEAINLVAATYGRKTLRPGDEVLISALEHHSNIVPWQLICEATGAVLRVIPINEVGALDMEAFHEGLGPFTRIVAVNHISNSLGTINPVEEIIQAAHGVGAVVLIDGAQAAPHLPLDVKALDADFYCLSGHKMYGPTGIGVLYGKRDLLEAMDPYQGGGDMIETVSFVKTTYNELPYKFEAGTPDIAGAVGLAAAAEYLNGLDREALLAHEEVLLAAATEGLQALPGVRIIGTAPHKASVVSFVIDGIHPYDAGTILDGFGIAVRTGHHCTQPLMECLSLPGTIRASFAFYNTLEEVERLIEGVERTISILA